MKEEVSHGAVHACALLQAEMPLLRFCFLGGAEAWMPAYVTAMRKRLPMHGKPWAHQSISTVFLGGGTPSVLPAEELRRLLRGVMEQFPLEPGAEFTSEANPGTLTEAWLDTAVSLGVNRLSLGMQAAQAPLLRTLGRIHTLEQVREAVDLARQAGVKT